MGCSKSAQGTTKGREAREHPFPPSGVADGGWRRGAGGAMTTDRSEGGLEELIVAQLTRGWRQPGLGEDPQPMAGLHGYVLGDPRDYDREHALDAAKLLAFLKATQPEAVATLGIGGDGPRRSKFLARLRDEIDRRGVVDLLRKGVRHGPAAVELLYGTPSPGNARAEELFAANIFSVTRQLRYSKNDPHLALDLAIFVNGLPVATFELKNSLTKQTVADAVEQYRRDRDPKEPLFRFGRCAVHFAVDDREVRMCTHLKGRESWFLPFNKGWNHGAGNPPNPDGIATDYLWKEVLARESLTDILENYAQIVEVREGGGRKEREQIFPRFHQLDAVRGLLADLKAAGAGKRYLIQHSAGSGKSNSIAWLAHRAIDLRAGGRPVFDTVVVVTDRLVLDRQIHDTVRQFAQVSSVVGHAEHAGDLRKLLEAGKKIVVTTVQKFPFVLDDIERSPPERTFAIVIDEAHSGQGGRATADMNAALTAQGGAEEEETVEDAVNRMMAARKMLPNASYLAFTATPKNRTLEIFGTPAPSGKEARRAPFHSYTMKQAIQEGFILDVLASYTPIRSYYRLTKTVADDPQFDAGRAHRKLRHYVESHRHAIARKAEIMIDHFHDLVIGRHKIGGAARAMVVTGGIRRAINYFHAFEKYLEKRKSPWRAIVAFSGEHRYGGQAVTEASLNGFPGHRIEENLRQDPYRFLIVADKFQTGYDEPLLHTMYVDRTLSGIKAVQTLSRLNRAHPHKHDTFVLDFMNDADTIQAAFGDYYRTTILSGETDPDKLHNLKAGLDSYQVYSDRDIEELVAFYLGGDGRETLDPILDRCVAIYRKELDEDGQVDFKGKAKSFSRTYGFLATILPWNDAGWEKFSIFLNLLIPKLPAPREEDWSRGILEAIDMDSYRAEAKAAMSIALADADAEIEPVPIGGGGGKPEPEIELLSNILREFNDQFGGIDWKDDDKIRAVITRELPARVSADRAYRNARKNSDRQNARIEHDRALERAIYDFLSDHAELFRQFSDNGSFRKWLSDTSFSLTYEGPQ